MKYYDDEAIERALAALPLEEAPPDLRGRILAATAFAPQPILRPWEVWIVGIALAVATWLTLAVFGSPLAGGPAEARAIGEIVDAAAATLAQWAAPKTLLWLAAGGLAALLFSQIGVPGTEIGAER